MNYLEAYEDIERWVIRAHEADDEKLASTLRDALDEIWHHKLAPEERAQLNARGKVNP